MSPFGSSLTTRAQMLRSCAAAGTEASTAAAAIRTPRALRTQPETPGSRL